MEYNTPGPLSARHQEPPQAAHNNSVMALMMDGSNMDRMIRMAEIMALGKTTIPMHLRGNVGDCMAITMQAMQWGMNPFSVAQKTHLVNGTLGYEGQLVAAVVNNSPLMADRLKMEWFGDWEKIIGKFKQVESRTKKDDDGNPKKFIVPDWNINDEKGLGIRVSGTIKGEPDARVLELLMTQCRTRNSGLWTEDPKQQIAYLAQRRWARLHTPDVMLGVYTPDELDDSGPRDMGPADIVGAPPPPPSERGTPPPYPQETLDSNIPAWRKAIQEGRATPEALIAKVGSKGLLTEAQKKQIRNLAPIENGTPPEATPPAAGPADEQQTEAHTEGEAQ